MQVPAPESVIQLADPVSPDALSLLVPQVAPLLHDGKILQAAQLAVDLLIEEPPKVATVNDATDVIRTLIYKLLYLGRLEESAQMLWPPSFFTPEPRSVQMIWRNIRKYSSVLLMGGSSMGKTYTPGVMFYLEWQRDPEFTNVICVGPSEEHLEANLFSHLVKLHQNTSIPMPGNVGKRWIGLDPRNKRGGIRGIVIPVGKKAAGRIQGAKRHPRPKPHPIFGKTSRVFLLLDELENIPSGVYSDLENIQSISGEEPDGFRLVGAYNPKDPTLRPYAMAEPLCGWEQYRAEEDEEWDSKLDYRVVRLDPKRSENVVTGQVIFTGLQTKIGYDKTVKASGGVGTPGYWTFARGTYPTQGSSTAAVPAHLFDVRRGEVVFVDRPASVAGCDMALEGGDRIPYCHGYYGRASGINRNGTFEPFLDTSKRPILRYVIQILSIYPLQPGNTVVVAANVKTMCQTLGVRGAQIMLDRTGNGAGVHDILKVNWDGGCRGINYSQSPTNMRVMQEDTETAEDRFPRIDSEIILAMRDWLENGYLWFHPDFDVTLVKEQLSTRKVYNDRGKQRVESKADYKTNHNGVSPDDGDSLGLTVHGVRVNYSPQLTAIPDGSNPRAEVETDAIVDITNTYDSLD